MCNDEVIWEEEWVKFLEGSVSCYTYINFSSLWTSASSEIFFYEVCWGLRCLFAMLHFLSLNTFIEAICGECREKASLTQVYYAAEIECSVFKRILSYSFSDSWQQNKSSHWTSKYVGLVYNAKLYGALWIDMDHVKCCWHVWKGT